MDYAALIAWGGVPMIGAIAAAVYGERIALRGTSNGWGRAISFVLILGFVLMIFQMIALDVCINLDMCINRGDQNMRYWFQSLYLIPLYWLIAVVMWALKRPRR